MNRRYMRARLVLIRVALGTTALFGLALGCSQSWTPTPAAPAPTATHSPMPTMTPTSTPAIFVNDPRRLARLLALNDYTASGQDLLALSETEQNRIIEVYEGYFVRAARVCDLDYDDLFWLFNTYAKKLDRASRRPWLGKLQESVPGGGVRLDFAHRIATNSIVQRMIKSKGSCDAYLESYTR